MAPLLAWVFGLGSFAAWFWLTTVPGFVLVTGSAVLLARRDTYPDLRIAIAAGILGGLAATALYDLVRVPFLAFGYRLFAPVNSYGILAVGASVSSPATDLLGWAYNFMNGTGFGVAYAMVALGRRWWWAIPFALLLETTTVVTPYADVYSLRGKPDVIAIAYGAHVFYGVVLGLLVQRAAAWRSTRDAPVPVLAAVGATALVLLLFNHPWTTPDYLAPAAALRPQPAAVVTGGVLRPEWMRVSPGGCVRLANRDDKAYVLSAPPGAATLAAHGEHTYCFSRAVVTRVQLNRVPYSGGWVLVDPSTSR